MKYLGGRKRKRVALRNQLLFSEILLTVDSASAVPFRMNEWISM